MSVRERLQEFPGLLIGGFRDVRPGLLIPAESCAENHDPSRYRTADFLFSSHAGAESAGQPERDLGIKMQLITK